MNNFRTELIFNSKNFGKTENLVTQNSCTQRISNFTPPLRTVAAVYLLWLLRQDLYYYGFDFSILENPDNNPDLTFLRITVSSD